MFADENAAYGDTNVCAGELVLMLLMFMFMILTLTLLSMLMYWD
jgi:hypothetical protein